MIALYFSIFEPCAYFLPQLCHLFLKSHKEESLIGMKEGINVTPTLLFKFLMRFSKLMLFDVSILEGYNDNTVCTKNTHEFSKFRICQFQKYKCETFVQKI